MRISHLCVLGLLGSTLVTCGSPIGAQVAPQKSVAQVPPSGPTVAASPAGLSSGLTVSISAIENPDDKGLVQPKGPFCVIPSSADDAHLNVVLQNTSSHPINIYREWNSWGYYNLHLEVTKIDGQLLPKPIVVSKGSRPWFRNFAEVQTIQPGGAIVREVRLAQPNQPKEESMADARGHYYGFPFKSSPYPFYTMRAVFEVPNTNSLPTSSGPWQGKIASPLTTYYFQSE